jgi:hypothetical protein
MSLGRLFHSALLALLVVSCGNFARADEPPPNVRLSEWSRGVSVDSVDRPDMRMYLWFYEWHMFGAMRPEQHSRGAWDNKIKIADDRLTATVESSNTGISLKVKAVRDGADLLLTVTNRSEHGWPELAAMIACFNPGPEESRNKQFANEKTWFLAADGLQPLAQEAPREIHYNHNLRTKINRQADDQGRYAWSEKWPASKQDATAGLIIRESNDGRWVTGIAWERFLSAQGHNPWECMHLSIHVGPLKEGETRKVRGRIYLLPGDKQTLLDRYLQNFCRP